MREIALLLVVKLCALSAIWIAFYRAPVIPSMTEGMDPNLVASEVLRHPLERVPRDAGDFELAVSQSGANASVVCRSNDRGEPECFIRVKKQESKI